MPTIIRKVVLVGNSGVGKTRMVELLLGIEIKGFGGNTTYRATLGVEVHPYRNHSHPSHVISIWEVGGKHRGDALSYYKKATHAIIFRGGEGMTPSQLRDELKSVAPNVKIAYLGEMDETSKFARFNELIEEL